MYILNFILIPPHRVVREGKERRRLWAQRKTPRTSKGDKAMQDLAESEPEKTQKEALDGSGMLPNDIVEMLAAREKYAAICVFVVCSCTCMLMIFNLSLHHHDQMFIFCLQKSFLIRL